MSRDTTMTATDFPNLAEEIQLANSIYIFGIGSELRSDDAAGFEFINVLEKEIKDKTGSKTGSKKVRLGYGAAAPENFTGDIVKFAPDLLIVFDAVCYPEKEPGDVVIVDKNTIGGLSFSTHSFPIPIILDFILAEHECRLIIVGIVPLDTSFGEMLTPVVKKSTGEFARTVASLIQQ